MLAYVGSIQNLKDLKDPQTVDDPSKVLKPPEKPPVWYPSHYPNVRYRGTSLIRKRPPPWDQHRALGIDLL